MKMSDDDKRDIQQWFDWIYDDNGELIEDAVLSELYDFKFMLFQVPAVYSSITCGKLSKANYFAFDVIQEAAECRDRDIASAVGDALDDIENGMPISEIRKAYGL